MGVLRPDVALDDLELELLLTGLVRRYGYDFRNYSQVSLKRRVMRALQLEELDTISALQARLLRDPEAMARFVATLSINVTSMFRDPAFFHCLRHEIVPVLKTYPYVRVWHAGCSTGEEVFSLAIVFQEEGIYDRSRIYATDISEEVLAQANRGIISLDQMKDNTRNYMRSGGDRDFSVYYRADNERAIFRKDLRRNLLFSHHNLVSDAAFNEFHLILCRNVLIYFDDTLRQRVHRLFFQSLSQFGILALGSRESLVKSDLISHYKALSSVHPIYRKQISN